MCDCAARTLERGDTETPRCGDAPFAHELHLAAWHDAIPVCHLWVSFAWGIMALMLIVITLLMVNLLIAMVRRSEHSDHTHAHELALQPLA